MNKKGDNGSPCLQPLEEVKVYEGELLIRIDNNTVDMREDTHNIHYSEKS